MKHIDLKEAAQAALEFIDALGEGYWGVAGRPIAEALRTALARDDKEIEKIRAENAWFKKAFGVRDAEDQQTIDTLKAENERLRAALAQEQQEPAAWMHDGFVSTNKARVEHDEQRNRMCGFKAKPIIPLYDHPMPEHKPLTIDQIHDLYRQCTGNLGGTEIVCIQIARAVERAHGIGVKE